MRRIIQAAEKILKTCGGRDIFEIAENSGAKVWFRELGGLKGFYISENGSRYIVINEALEDNLKKVVCAHELGHDTLHRELSAGGLREGTLFFDSNKTEREANLFAACVLITDEEILEAMSENASLESVSASLELPPEIILYKLETMNFKGYDFNLNEIKSDFLK